MYDGFVLAAAVGTWVATRRQPQGRRLPWGLIATGVTLFLVGDLIYDGWQPLTGTPAPFPNIGDAFHVGGYPPLLGGMALVIRKRSGGRELPAFLDSAIVTVGLGLVLWFFVAQPYASDSDLPAGLKVLLLAYPLLDAALLATAVRLAVGGGSRPPAFWLLLLGAGTLVVTDTPYGLAVLDGSFIMGGPLDSGWMVAYGCLAAAGLHRTSPQLCEPAGRRTERFTWDRMVLLSMAALLAPALGAFQPERADNIVADVAAGAVIVLVLLRMGGLLVALARSTDQIAELQRQRGERRFRNIVQRAVDIVLVFDADARITYATPSAHNLFGSDPTGWSTRDFRGIMRDGEWARLTAEAGPFLAGHMAQFTTKTSMRRHDGRWRKVEFTLTDLRDDPDVEGMVATLHDVTEREALEEQLFQLAYHDALTALPNRMLFGDIVHAVLDRAQQAGTHAALLFIDLDDFKDVNDSLGHTVGDALLRRVAKRLEASLPAGAVAARLGGDEFGVLLEELDEEAVSCVADILVAALQRPFDVDGNDVTVTASIGIAYAADGHTAADLLRNADAAMYQAKHQGRDGWRAFHPEFHEEALNRLKLTADLRRALEGGELRVVYQPVVDVSTQKVVSVEALSRWNHPERGPIGPAEFIALAERTGLIIPLGRLVLQTACDEAARWTPSQPGPAPGLTVNISTRQLRDPGFVDMVKSVLRVSGLKPERLTLELTETVLLEDPDHALETFAILRKMGIGIAIDDFGTGYSSLGYLQRLPMDVLKIDRTFVSDLGHGAPRATLVHSILELARSLGMTTIAEGVETEAQLIELRELGCPLAQGFLFARPLEAIDLRERLELGGPDLSIVVSGYAGTALRPDSDSLRLITRDTPSEPIDTP